MPAGAVCLQGLCWVANERAGQVGPGSTRQSRLAGAGQRCTGTMSQSKLAAAEAAQRSS